MSLVIVYYENGIPVREWDDDLRLYTERDKETAEVTNQRPYTDEENAQRDARAADETKRLNEADLLARASQALGANKTFLALATPTNAQSLAQIRSLTKQVNALIRLRVRDFSDVSDT